MKTTARKPPVEAASGLESFATGPDGTHLYVRQRVGRGETVFLLCDGIVCDRYIYKYLWDDLAEFGGVAHWNYRGHGRSCQPIQAVYASSITRVIWTKSDDTWAIPRSCSSDIRLERKWHSKRIGFDLRACAR